MSWSVEEFDSKCLEIERNFAFLCKLSAEVDPFQLFWLALQAILLNKKKVRKHGWLNNEGAASS